MVGLWTVTARSIDEPLETSSEWHNDRGTSFARPPAGAEEGEGTFTPVAAEPQSSQTGKQNGDTSKAGASRPGARVEWKYLGPALKPDSPPLLTIVGFGQHSVATGFAPSNEQSTATTIIWDAQTARSTECILKPVPLSLVDGHGELSGLALNADRTQQIIHQRRSDGTATMRIVVLPQPGLASAKEPYMTSPAHYALDGTLVLLGTGRDRFYRINPALGSVQTILPLQAMEIVDFDIADDGNIVALDAFDRQLVWMNFKGEVLSSSPLTSNEGQEPSFYFLSVAAAEGQAAWVGAVVREDEEKFLPEVQRIRGKLRERQRLVRGEGSLGLPLLLASDGNGGVYAADEGHWLYHVSQSAVVTQVWKARINSVCEGSSSAGDGPEPATRKPLYLLSLSGTVVEGLDSAMEDALPALDKCYGQLREVSPQARGSYRISLTTLDRSIRTVEVYQKNFDDFGLESCVATALRKLKLSSRFGHQTLHIQLDFVPAVSK